jgi:hypothetical protein
MQQEKRGRSFAIKSSLESMRFGREIRVVVGLLG